MTVTKKDHVISELYKLYKPQNTTDFWGQDPLLLGFRKKPGWSWVVREGKHADLGSEVHQINLGDDGMRCGSLLIPSSERKDNSMLE